MGMSGRTRFGKQPRNRYSLPYPRFYNRTRKAIRPGLPAAASASDHAIYQPNPTPLPIPVDISRPPSPTSPPFDNIHNGIGLPLSTTSNSGTHLRACLGWHRASCCGHTQCSGCAAADRRGRGKWISFTRRVERTKVLVTT
jgi:hypothetical protein